MKATDLTPYADVNGLVGTLLTAVRAILNDQFVGMVLNGSLASGDFDYDTSDIDFVVVTAVSPTAAQFEALAAMHGRIGQTATKWARELEGAYIPLDALRRYDRTNATHAYIDRDASHLRWEHLDVDWIIHRHVLYHHGITLAGPPIQTLIDPISTSELCQAVQDLLTVWWVPMIEDPGKLQHEGYRMYAILTMCRMHYTWVHGDVVSKPVAARWALESLAPGWQPLIRWALTRPSGAPVNNLSETQKFIQYTFEQSLSC